MAVLRRHVIISGTGRAGTSFLVHLLTHCGLDTGYSPDYQSLSKFPNAGLERDIRRDDAPYIVKAPQMCDYMSTVLRNPEIVIEHAIIPVRTLDDAANSRIRVARISKQMVGRNGAGGLWGTSSSRRQRAVLAEKFATIVSDLVAADIPITFLHFPRFVEQVEYCCTKLSPIFPAVEDSVFKGAFAKTADPRLVHKFNEPLPGISFRWQSAVARVRRLRDSVVRAATQ